MKVIWIKNIMGTRIYREVGDLRRAMGLRDWREIAYYENAYIGVKR